MTLHPKFKPAFLTLKTFEGLEPDDAPASPAVPKPPLNRQSGLARFNDGRLEQYIQKEHELPVQHRFATLVDRVVIFANTNAPKLQPPMSKARLTAINKDFQQFKEHITIKEHFGPHNQQIFSVGKETFSDLHRLLENDRIELHSKMDALAAMAPSMPMCAGGVMSAVQGGVTELRYSACGLQGAAQLKKEALVESVINNFVENNHHYDEGNHVHYVNAYFNHMAADLGLPERNDPFDTIPQKEMTAELRTHCRHWVMQTLQPVTIAMALAESYLGKLQGAAGDAGLNLDGFHVDDSLTKLCKVIAEINHAVLHKEFGEVPQACYLLAPTNGDDTLFAYRLAKRPDLIAKHFVEKLKDSNLIDYDKALSLSEEGAEAGTLRMLSSLMWVEHDDETLEANAQDLLIISPIDMAARLKEQKIERPELAQVFKTIGEQVLNEVGATPKVISPEWAENFVATYKSALPLRLQDMQQMLKHTAYTGNLEMLQALLKHEANPNATDIDHGQTVLMVAAKAGHTPVMAHLLKAGADVNLGDRYGATAVMAAAIVGQIPALECLIKAGANLDVISRRGENPLLNAAYNGNLEVIQCLVRNRADKNIADSKGYTPLMIATLAKKIAVADFLITEKAELNSKNYQGDTALAFAAGLGLTTIAIKLIDNGADVNACNHNKRTPSIEAAAGGYVEVLQALMAKNADTDAQDLNGCYAGLMAAYNGRADILKMLIDAKKDIQTADTKGMTPLMAAAHGSHVTVMQQLIDAEVDINMIDHQAHTALMRSCLGNQLESARCLITNGANLEISDGKGYTALMMATQRGYPQVVEALVNAKASIEATTAFGTTPLMIAAKAGNVETLNVLIKAGAKLDVVESNFGWNAAAYAAFNNQPAVLQCLIEADIKITEKDNRGNTLAILAVMADHIDGLTILINSGAALDERSSTGKTCLYMAAEFNKIEAVALLADSKADLNVPDFQGRTPLLIALGVRNLEVVSLLIAAGADVNVSDNYGWTAAKLVHPEDVELKQALVAAGARFD